MFVSCIIKVRHMAKAIGSSPIRVPVAQMTLSWDRWMPISLLEMSARITGLPHQICVGRCGIRVHAVALIGCFRGRISLGLDELFNWPITTNGLPK